MITDLVVEDARVSVGTGTYATAMPVLHAHHPGNRIVIGKYCSFARNVTVFAGGNHPLRHVTTHPLMLYFGRATFAEWSEACGDDEDVTVIGNDVWIGDGALILSGVTVGDGAVIGARSTVAADVPPYAVVAGNPARVLRKRFGDAQIDALLGIRWWDWRHEHVASAVPYLCSGNVEAFIAFARAAGWPPAGD